MGASGAPEGWELIGSLTKNDEARQAGRQRLMRGARACFASKGYSGTVVGEIAEAAGVSVGSVYKYVRSKEDLLWLLAEAAHRTIQEAIDKALAGRVDALDALLAATEALIRVSDENIDLMVIFHSEFRHMPAACRRRVRQQDADLVDRIAKIIRTGIATGRLNCPDPHFAAVTVEMTATTWILKRRLLGSSLAEYVEAQRNAVRALVTQ